ncbi:hypothetical protein [Epilithonimonas zeae]|uniref:hypothetical protein n=1 Tax=Epilithonimonas zeae TaxID=1416779 RepID=UPI00200F871C|nr:hypothetical protein [Epilithonimonas zeae]UQB69513.1 hypothetical protein KI430_03540 [Epilithonimonas zeae]
MTNKISRIFSLILFLVSFICFSQIKIDKNQRKVKEEVYVIDSISNSNVDSTSIIMHDSISVKVLKFDKRIITQNILKNRNTHFEIKYYFKNNDLFFVKIEEQHPYLNDLKKHSEYYIINNKISSTNYYMNIRGCLAISVEDMKNGMGYNNQLTEKFMQKYVFKLYRKIKKLKPKYY